MIGARLTMRAAVERPIAAGIDRWGQPDAIGFDPVATVACFVWSNTAREIVDGDKVATAEDMRGLFARGADLAENDELAAVTDQRGRVLIPGRLRIEGPVQFKHTHLEAALRRVG